MSEILDFPVQIILRVFEKNYTGTETFRAVNHQDGEIWREKKEASHNVMNTDLGFVPAASDTHMNVYTYALFGKIPDDTNVTPAHPLVLLFCCTCTSAALRSVQMYSSQACLKYAMNCRSPGTVFFFVVLSVLMTDNCIS